MSSCPVFFTFSSLVLLPIPPCLQSILPCTRLSSKHFILDASVHTLILTITWSRCYYFSCSIIGAREKPSNLLEFPELVSGRVCGVYRVCTLTILSHCLIFCGCLNEKCAPWAWVFRHLVALSGEIVEPLGDGTLLEEIHQWEQALSVYSLTLLPVHSLCLLLWLRMWPLNLLLQPPCLPLAAMLLYHYGFLSFWSHQPK